MVDYVWWFDLAFGPRHVSYQPSSTEDESMHGFIIQYQDVQYFVYIYAHFKKHTQIYIYIYVIILCIFSFPT